MVLSLGEDKSLMSLWNINRLLHGKGGCHVLTDPFIRGRKYDSSLTDPMKRGLCNISYNIRGESLKKETNQRNTRGLVFRNLSPVNSRGHAIYTGESPFGQRNFFWTKASCLCVPGFFPLSQIPLLRDLDLVLATHACDAETPAGSFDRVIVLAAAKELCSCRKKQENGRRRNTTWITNNENCPKTWTGVERGKNWKHSEETRKYSRWTFRRAMKCSSMQF